MANKTLIKKNQQQLPLVISQLVIRQPNRSTSDVGSWRNALRSADAGRVKALFDLYDDLLIDTTLGRSWEKRVEAVTNSELTFQYDDGETSDEINELMQSLSWETLLTGIISTKSYGRSAVEFDFSNGFHVDILPFKHINLDNQTILINDSDERGIDYLADPHLLVLGAKRDFGIFLKTAPYAIWKRGGFGDYAQWLEIFGMPQRIGKYSSYDPQSRILLEQALQNAGSAPWCVIPKETDVETVNNTGNGSSGVSFNDFRQACNEEMLIAVLGQTLTTIAGTKGARSLGDVHKEVEEGINKSDLRYTERVLNSYVKPLLEQRGFNVKGGKFIFPSAAEAITVDELISLTKIIRIPASFVHDKYSIPAAQDGEELAGERQQAEEPQEEKKEEPTSKDKKPASKDKPETNEAKTKEEESEELSDRNFLLQLWDKTLGAFFADAPTKWSGAYHNFKRTWTRRLTGNVSLGDGYSINIDKLINEALQEVYGSKGEELVNKKLFDITNDALQHAVDTSLTRNDVDEGFINEFKENTAVFAAFKNHQQTKEIAALLYDEEGNLVPFYKFKKRALQISEKYNVQWLQTEYNTAVRAARTAANLKKYEKTAHLYPNLEYMPTRAANPRHVHLEYVGVILPINHPAWAWLLPPSDWNCDCWVRPTDKEATEAPIMPSSINPIFINNPALTAQFLNTKETPYYKHTDVNLRDQVAEEGKRLNKESEALKDVYIGKEGGILEIVKQQGNERAKNLTTYSIMADNGGKYKLLRPGTATGVKNPDAINLATGLFSDAKHPVTENGKNAIQRSIRDANKQGVGEVIIRLEKEYPSKELYSGFRAALQEGRAKNINTIVLIRNGRKPLYFEVAKLIERFARK
ncbi:DUF935 family protein [Dysgonomonas sp. Marseille-P4361]|uniref:phage portal protein family protein n=1 Tax=Dysgonomonas sp. Marseille-P4361 TaxID=2161820 RepID=UPI000D552419|nr:DUF935 family protein [Dysgonomonas sp. Marseille-P4361]